MRRAVSKLGAADYLSPSTFTPSDTEPTDAERAQARAILRVVRRTVNEFRDDRSDGLVRAHNRLIGTMVFTGLTAYVLLALALLAEVPSRTIEAAAAFYLVGAIVGLFNRLHAESGTEAAIQDYGLSRARLIQTPLFSGLAAVGGVLLTAMLTAALNDELLVPPAAVTPATTASAAGVGAPTTTPTAAGAALVGAPTAPVDIASPAALATVTPTATATPTTTSANLAAASPNAEDAGTGVGDQDAVRDALEEQPIPQLPDIFDLNGNRFGLVIAAIFGLTPNLLIRRLQEQTDRYKDDLQSTEAPNQS